MADTEAVRTRVVALRGAGMTWPQIGKVIAGEFGGSDKPERVRRLYRDWQAAHAHAQAQAELADGAGSETSDDAYAAAVSAAARAARSKIDEQTFKRLLAERGRTELMVEAIRDAVQAMPPLELPPVHTIHSRYPDEEACLIISDSHVGERVTLEETGGLGEYNLEIFRRRARNLTRSVREIRSIEGMARNIRRLHVWFLGDIVDNEVIFPGHKDHIETDVVSQVFEATREFVPMLTELQKDFEEVRCVGLVGNHGRTGRKGEAKTHVSFDYLTYKFLEAYTASQPRISWEIPQAWWHIANVQGHNFLLLHGDDIKAWNGIPFYGVQRADGRYTKLMGSQQITYEYMAIGHFHNPAEIDSVGGELLINGAWPGVSMFSLKTLNTMSLPSQFLFGVSRRRGVTWRYKVALDDVMGLEESV